MPVNRMAQVLCALAILCGCIFGQTTTGTLLGTVADPGDAAVPGAPVELKNTATGAVITTTTGVEGIFRFNSLVPATYNLTIKPAAGFKTYTQTNIEVTASEVRDLGKISLSLGAITEQVSVTAAATPIQTASGENSKLIDSAQMNDITLKGRDLFGLLVMLPGIANRAAGHHQRELHRIGAHQRRHRRPGELHGGRNFRHRHRQQHHSPLRTEHGFDRRSPRADRQLPGGVRPQLQRHDQRGDQERQPAVPRQRLGQQAA